MSNTYQPILLNKITDDVVIEILKESIQIIEQIYLGIKDETV